MSAGKKKIPSTCPGCDNQLSRRDMEAFLDLCEKWGRDPIDLAYEGSPPGIFCGDCILRRIAEGAEDQEAGGKLMVAKMRLHYLGVEELPDGKPVVWH